MTKKNCIICNNPARSGEHVFPAVFGGRRINRGIYCETHNNAFGCHVNTLLNSLDIFNAIIGVIPDRQKEIRPTVVTGKGAEQYQLSKDTIKIAPPRSLSETPELVGKQVMLKFADQKQRNKWICDQKEAGFSVEFESTDQAKRQIITESLHTQKQLGDESFMRALLYLALTFLAHKYPEMARSSGLARARDIIAKDGSVENRVLWEPPSTMEQLFANPFTYGHTVAIGSIANTNKIGALISFFGAFHFSIDLGELTGGDYPTCITTHIDPLAKSPPNDIQEIQDKEKTLIVSTSDESRRYLHELRTGTATSSVISVFQSAGRAALLKTCEALRLELFALKTAPPSMRLSRIMVLLDPHDQLIFNLMKEVIQDFSQSTTDIPTLIHDVLKFYITANDDAPRGIDCNSEAALHIVKASIADTILTHINDDTLDKETLANLLGGGVGQAIALRTLTDIIANILPP